MYDSTKKAIKKYDRTHTKRYSLKLNTKTDADIIAKLDAVKNRQGYIKQLVIRDIRMVRCRTCRYYHPQFYNEKEDYGFGYCYYLHKDGVFMNHYCFWGSKREDIKNE